MKIAVYNKNGITENKKDLPKEIFGVDVNPSFIHQIITCQRSNRRQNTAHSKDRSAVSGGGKKPWRQKGTGRARHGSNRSPIWKGGGVTFGPTNERNYKKKINRKEKTKALFMTLTGKLSSDLLLLVEDLTINEPKTKELSFLLNLPCAESSVLIAASKNDKNLILAARNIPNVDVIEARNLTALDVLSYKYLVLPDEAIETIKETFI